MQLSLQDTAMLHSNFTPDFLLAQMGDDTASPLFLRPCRARGVAEDWTEVYGTADDYFFLL